MPLESKECRQGSVLTRESAISLGLVDKESIDKYCVIITHDCDIYHPKEQRVECIVATKPVKVNTSFSYAAHPRILNITYTLGSSDPITLELTHAGKKEIPKGQFLEKGKVATDFRLPVEEKRALKIWLAARYGRVAFPDELEARLRKEEGFEKRIRCILEPYESHLIGIFFLLGEDRFNELSAGTPYCLTIAITYNGINGTVAREAAETCSQKLMDLFHKVYGTPDIAEDIALENCVAISDMDFTLHDIRKADQWRIDSISLQAPQSALLSVGQAPA